MFYFVIVILSHFCYFEQRSFIIIRVEITNFYNLNYSFIILSKDISIYFVSTFLFIHSYVYIFDVGYQIIRILIIFYVYYIFHFFYFLFSNTFSELIAPKKLNN